VRVEARVFQALDELCASAVDVPLYAFASLRRALREKLGAVWNGWIHVFAILFLASSLSMASSTGVISACTRFNSDRKPASCGCRYALPQL
jgi:hypothetical protein